MCEPATLATMGSWFAGSSAAAGTAAAATAAGTAATTAGTGLALAASEAAFASALAGSTTTAAAGMTTAQMISLGLTAAGTGVSVMGAVNQSRAAQETANRNAQIAEQQAADAMRRGEKEATDVQRRAAAFKSSQRVGLAAKGLDLSYGTAADLQDQTDFFGASDVATTRTNARKEAWARSSQSSNFQAEALSQRPWLVGGGTLLAGAGQVADKWNMYRGR